MKKDAGKIELKQTSESYRYEANGLERGSYLPLGEFMPTFLMQDEDGKRYDDGTKQSVKIQNTAYTQPCLQKAS